MSQANNAPDTPVPDVPPKVAPENVTLRSQPRPVTRLNRRMLVVLAGGLATAVLGGTIWSLQSTQRRGAGDQKELYNADRVSRSEGLDRLPADYSKLPPALPPAVPQLGAPLPGDLGGPIHKAEQRAQGYGDQQPGHDPAEIERLARLKQAEEAAASSVFFRSGGQKVAAAPQSQVLPAARALALNAAFDPMAAGPASTAAQPADPTTVQNRQDQKEAFLSKTGSTETHNSGSLQMPASPYQVMAGTVIAAALVTGIKYDLPGDVIATVTEPVYDTATGKYMLIPQGSHLLGTCKQPSKLWTEPRAGGVESGDPAGHVLVSARQAGRHRSGRLCGSGRWGGLALGSRVRQCRADHLASTATRKYRNMKARLRTHGGVASLAKAASLRCGLRLALGTKPTLSFCSATFGLQY